MYTSSFSFNNDNSDFINFETIFGRTDFETIFGRTVRSRTENGSVLLDEEKPSGEELEYLDEIEREQNYEFGFCEYRVHRDSNRSI